jgi:hypothetical protein
MPPPYDDANYFVEALKRLRLFQQSGLWTFAKDLWVHPPHSVYSEVGAFLGFLIGGVAPEHAYAVNAIAAALIAATVATAFRWSIGLGAAFFAFMISLPWLDQVITIYHPDLVSGLAVATACIILLWQDQLITSSRRAALAGAVLGLALLVKATAVPFALAITGLSFVLGAIVARSTEGDWNGSFKRLTVGAPVTLLIVCPYYVVTFVELRDYIKTALITQRDIFGFHGSLTDHLLYFPLRAKEILWYWPVIAVALVLVRLLNHLVQKRWADVQRFCALLIVIFVAYLVPTLPEVKTALFGGTFYAILVLALGIVAADAAKLISCWCLRERTFVSAAVVPAVLVIAAVVQFSDGQTRFAQKTIVQSTAVYDQIFSALKAQADALLQVGKPRQVLIYMPNPEITHTPALIYRGLRDGVDIGFSYPDEMNSSALYETVDHADVVVVPDAAIVAGVVASGYALWINPLLPQFRDWISANPRFSKVGDVSWGPGRVLVYRAVAP